MTNDEHRQRPSQQRTSAAVGPNDDGADAPDAGRRGVLLGVGLGVGLGMVGGSLATGAMAAPAQATDSRVVGTAEDERAIRQLSIDYALATDAIGGNDRAAGLARYLDAFTDDALIMVAGSDDSRCVGAAQWAAYVDGVFRRSGYDRTQHLVGTIDVRFAQGSHRAEGAAGQTQATMSTYLHATHHVTDSGALDIVLGTYVDDVVQVSGQWRIARRVLSVTASWVVKPA